jgi:hypothetical protein
MTKEEIGRAKEKPFLKAYSYISVKKVKYILMVTLKK